MKPMVASDHHKELERMMQVLSGCIGLQVPPKVVWSSTLPRNVLGSYDHQRRTINVHFSVKPSQVPTTVLHELCHAVLYRVGQTGTGHGVAFLALYRLMLQKARLQDTDTIESCAVANWNPWTPWPIWYRHVSEAREIACTVIANRQVYEMSDAETMAREVLSHTSRSGSLLPRWLTLRWTEIIADTRGHWFALWGLQRMGLMGLAVLSLLLIAPKMPRSLLWAAFGSGVTLVCLWHLSRLKQQLNPWSKIRNVWSNRDHSD